MIRLKYCFRRRRDGFCARFKSSAAYALVNSDWLGLFIENDDKLKCVLQFSMMLDCLQKADYSVYVRNK